MHLLGARHLDRMGRQCLVVELHSRAAVRARAVRQLLAERERAVGVHTASIGQLARWAKANDLQRHRFYSARSGLNLSRTIVHPATLSDIAVHKPMLLMRLQLKFLPRPS